MDKCRRAAAVPVFDYSSISTQSKFDAGIISVSGLPESVKIRLISIMIDSPGEQSQADCSTDHIHASISWRSGKRAFLLIHACTNAFVLSFGIAIFTIDCPMLCDKFRRASYSCQDNATDDDKQCKVHEIDCLHVIARFYQ